AHCAVNGEAFCKLKEEYLSTNVPADEVLDRFYELASDRQIIETDREVMRRMEFLKSADTMILEKDPGRMAAEKWLHNYRYGKGR
ncbi:MAG: hypothetical protein ACPL07_00750, partial [Candidatus Bathyarchaeia archaeon]